MVEPNGADVDPDGAVTRILGPEGFILSPVDNVRDTSDATWENVLTFVEAWKAAR